MKTAWLHVDMDGLDAIYAAQGSAFTGSRDDFYTTAIDNSLSFFDRHGVKATYFLIARDLDIPEKRAGIRKLVAEGHRIASHSYSHPSLLHLNGESLRREIVDSKAKIEDALGVACKGFRAPGYTITRPALTALAEAGYQYDSSIFPNFALRKRLGMERLLPEPHILFRDPRLFEVPMPQGFPGLPPFHPCYAFYLGFPYFRRSLNAYSKRHDHLTFLYHFTDFAERQADLSTFKMKVFTNNFFSGANKLKFLDRMLEVLRPDYRFTLVEDFLDRWDDARDLRPRTILGVSTTHETGACIVQDGKILSAVTEERLSRKKLDTQFPPVQSIREAIEVAGIAPQAIDAVAVAGLRWPDLLSKSLAGLKADVRQFDTWTDVFPHMFRLPYRLFGLMRARGYGSVSKFLLSEYGISPKVHFIEHHQAHAASAYRTGNQQDAIVITADGVGDEVCFTISEVENGALVRKKEWLYPTSFGQFYTACTQVLGFRAGHHEGKITGLAAFGKLDPAVVAAVSSTLHLGEFSLNKKYYVEGLARGFIKAGVLRGRFDVSKLDHRNYKAALKKLLAPYPREDVARTYQHILEEKVVETVQSTTPARGRHLAVAGGVFANVKLNAALFARTGAQSIWVFPAMGDGGLAVGAALELTAEPPREIGHVYLGSAYGDDAIEATLRTDARIWWTRPDDMAETAAALLADGKTMARFAGAMEYGPRALGNRSILYHCRSKDVNDWLNKQLKRTEFMPFAPICLYEDAEQYFLIKGGEKRACEFMTIVVDCTERMRTECPAAVHVDGTARPQLVRRETNPDVHALISAYKKLTGSSCLINTSFNMHEEPIIRSPSEAVEAFLQAGLDYLIAGPFLVRAASSPPGRARE